MREGKVGLGFAGVLTLLGCAASTTDAPSGGGATRANQAGNSGNSAGGQLGNSGGIGENAGSAGNAGSTGNALGGAGSGAPPTAPSALPQLQCAAGEVVYRGTVGGVATSERLTLNGPSAGAAVLGAYSGGASATLVGSSSQSGTLTLAGGTLRFPTGSANAGKIWCIDSGSLLGQGQRPAGALIGHLLGTCPGTPVTGTLYACSDASQGYCDDTGASEKRALGGVLAGKALESPAVGLTKVSAQAWASSTQLFDVLLFADSLPSATHPAQLNGLLVATIENPNAGDVYCVGAGEWKQYSDDSVLNADIATLNQLSYVGSCANSGPSESLDVCIGL